MNVRDLIARGASAATMMALRFDFDETTGLLNKVRVLGIPVFDRRRWNARQERKQRAKCAPKSDPTEPVK